MIRDETEIVYATLRDLATSFPKLNGPPRVVFDYSPAQMAGEDPDAPPKFPAVGIRLYHDGANKDIDRRGEFCRTEKDGKVYAWYEVGEFQLGCTVALFAASNDQMPNPVPFLRAWRTHIKQAILQHVLFPAVGDPVPGQHVELSVVGEPFDQEHKGLFSTKLSITARGEVLIAKELPPPVFDGSPARWLVSSNPQK